MTDDLPDNATDTPVTPDTEPLLTAQEAATLLGVSERTIRRRINAGELPSAKVGGQYRIPASAVGRVSVDHAGRVGQAAGHGEAMSGTTGQAAGHAGHAGQASDAPVVHDLEPLADLIANLTRENRQLAEAAAVWQERARGLQEQLLALTAGEPTQDAAVSRHDEPGAAEGASTANEPSSGLRAWWKRLWGGR